MPAARARLPAKRRRRKIAVRRPSKVEAMPSRTMHVVMTVACLAWSMSSHAELTNDTAPVIVGHYHLNVTSIAQHRQFWVDTLGGKAVKIGRVEAIEFPDVYLLLHEQAPTGPTRGTTFDHIGFAVP